MALGGFHILPLGLLIPQHLRDLFHGKIAKAVDDGTSLIQFDGLKNVRMVTDHGISTGIDGKMCITTYTHHRGLAAVTRWVRLKYAAMNLKKLANWSWNNSVFSQILLIFMPKYTKTPVFA